MFNMNIAKVNNFDLIRLLAAFQVVFVHAVSHFEITNPLINQIAFYFRFFPGVKIFFFISGFLILWSLQRNSSSLLNFYKNRALRIFPGLWVCVFITLILMLIQNKTLISLVNIKTVLIYLVSQLTIFQFYTPDLLRYWGVGTPNGSLWTITVELQFYLVIPFFYYLFTRYKKIKILVPVLIIFTFGLNLFTFYLTPVSLIAKLYTVSVFPYLFYFLLGMLLFLYWNSVKNLFESKFYIWLFSMIIFIVYVVNFNENNFNEYYMHNVSGFISTILLLGLIFSSAFTNNSISRKLLKGNDISFGLYIYHMVILNLFYHNGSRDNLLDLLLMHIITFIVAYFSWILIEKNVLKLKRFVK